jgi:thiamine biosynthesis protein ThiS
MGQMQIRVKLYSTLREKLPPENKGQAEITLGEDARVADLLAQLDIERRVVVSVNEEHVTNRQQRLKDGDFVRIFSSVGGG